MPIDRTSSSAIEPFHDKSAGFQRRIFRYTGPSSYAAGGESLDPMTAFGLGRVAAVLGVISNGSAVRVLWWDKANSKLKAFVPNTGAEASGDLSGYSGTLEAIGQ